MFAFALGGSICPPTAVFKRAAVPKGTPVHQTWHLTRSCVMRYVHEALCCYSKILCLVGLVGDSGSSKTTVASEFVLCVVVQQRFSHDIVWLPVNDGAKVRLSWLMLKLATKVCEEGSGSNGDNPATPRVDPTHYIESRMRGNPWEAKRRCFIIADNVCDAELVAELLKIDMSVLITTRRK